MTEKVRIRLDNQFYLEVEAVDPEDSDADDFSAVHQIQELSPYGMMLAGVGSCTAMVVTTYAQNHDISLDEIEITLEYAREFKEDCEQCEGIERYDDNIYEAIRFQGDLSDKTREKLKKIAHQCPLEKMIGHGVTIEHRDS
ncbi:MAG TPA: OsmC family protein [Anaerolineales bacterium]|nr:OsmC family protein [Anaerolineales bacterium]